jgi:hypothetical protein
MITLFRSRSFPRFALALGGLAFCVFAPACNKVPLLAPSGSSITLTASATVLPVNGTTQLIAQVLESAGTPPQDGTLVTFTTTLGTIQPPQAETSGGRVVVTFLAGTASGTATITATSGGAGGGTTGTGATASASNTVKIAIGAAAVGGVTASANPATVAASGGSSTISANVRDTNGNVLSGVPVSFTTDNGSLSAGVVTTDQSGNAQTTLTTTKVSKVTASAGVASGSGTTGTAAQTATVTVAVNSPPSVSVGAPSPASPSVGQSVTFPLTYAADATGSPIQSVTVDFGDGSKATTFPGKPSSVTHTYNAIGSYSVRATALDALGDTSTAAGSVNVVALGSVIVGAPSPSTPSVGQAVTFPLTYSTTGGSPIQRISVDWGDGTSNSYTGTPSSVNHTYTSGGTFAMRVTAFDAFGNTSSGGTSLTVGARPQPTVSITTGAQNPQAGSDVTFTVTVTPASGTGTSIQDVFIDFGDGTTKDLGPSSGTITVHHVYDATGTYTVVVTATDSNGGVGRAATTVFVQAAPPLGVTLTASAATGTLFTVETFTATVTGLGNSVVTSYLWEWGNLDPPQETTSNQVTHQYPHGVISYTVRVTVTTSNGRQASNTTVITP